MFGSWFEDVFWRRLYGRARGNTDHSNPLPSLLQALCSRRPTGITFIRSGKVTYRNKKLHALERWGFQKMFWVESSSRTCLLESSINSASSRRPVIFDYGFNDERTLVILVSA